MRTLSLTSFIAIAIMFCIQSVKAAEHSTDLGCFDTHLAHLYQNGWYMLEDMFITQPQAYVDESLLKKGLIAGLSAGAGLGCYALSQKALDLVNAPDVLGNAPYPYLDRKRRHITIGTGLTTR